MSRTASFSLTDSLAIERCQTSGHGRADVRAIIMSRISLKASQHFNLGRMDQGGLPPKAAATRCVVLRCDELDAGPCTTREPICAPSIGSHP